jgi:hypothetical protein
MPDSHLPAAPLTKTGASFAVLDENEEFLFAEVINFLQKEFPEEVPVVEERFSCVRSLADAISRFPKVEGVQHIRGMVRDERNLIASLGHFSPSSRMFHMPTRIIASHSLLVAKSHAFSLLSLLTSTKPELQNAVRRAIFSIICVLMAEDVYISCLDEPSFSQEKKDDLANDLFLLWNSGSDPRSSRYAASLEALWEARNSSPPSFGTMEGASELFRISLDLDQEWQDFVVQRLCDQETRWALEEFLFGLSYEEILQVRTRLKRFGINAVDAGELFSFLGNEPAFTVVAKNDPRAAYDFYVDRRDVALMRSRTASPGPRSTLEELYLKYHITRER